MRDYPISTRVTIDGVDAYAVKEDLAAGRPTILDGMQISWGRDSLADQPNSGSCNFVVQEQVDTGVPTIVDAIHTGAQVDVWCTADDGSTGADPMQWSIAAQPAGTLSNIYYSGTRPGDTEMTVSVTSTHVARCRPAVLPANWAAGIVFPPEKFNGAKGSWDHVQRILPGQTWTVKITARMPLNGGVGQLYVLATSSTSRDGQATVMPVQTDQLFPRNDGVDVSYYTVTGQVTLPEYWDDPNGAWVMPGVYAINNPSSGAYIDVQSITVTPTSEAVREVLVWSGEIATAIISPQGDRAVRAAVTCIDPSGPLSNITIGDLPWPIESIAARSQKIIDLAGVAGDTTYLLDVDTGLQSVRVQARDVDAQPAYGMLQDLAASAGGALWPAASATKGAYLWMEDPQSRMASRVLVVDASGQADIVTANGITAVSVLSSADMLRDPVSWTQDPSTAMSSFDVKWLQAQGTDPETGSPITIDRTVTRTHTTLRAAFGFRKLSVDTELAYKGDAETLANRMMLQAPGAVWRFDGLNIDTECLNHTLEPGSPTQQERLSLIMDLLDGVRRIGKAVRIPDMPVWTPGGVDTADGTELIMFIEGGTYELTDWQWKLDLKASPADGQGHSITWNEMPAELSWDEMNDITWNDLYGVGPS